MLKSSEWDRWASASYGLLCTPFFSLRKEGVSSSLCISLLSLVASLQLPWQLRLQAHLFIHQHCYLWPFPRFAPWLTCCPDNLFIEGGNLKLFASWTASHAPSSSLLICHSDLYQRQGQLTSYRDVNLADTNWLIYFNLTTFYDGHSRKER
jgi:hypothetical protein